MNLFIKTIKSAFTDLAIIYGGKKPKDADRADFIFLIHPRHRKDIEKYFPFLKVFPDSILRLIIRMMWPVRAHKIETEHNGKIYYGWTIGLLLLPEQMLKNRMLARKKVLQALRLGKGLKAKIAGLGALTPSVTAGGSSVADKSPIPVTNGYAMTVSAVAQTVLNTIKEGELESDNLKIAIVGAAGSVGSNVAKILSNRPFKKIILLDVERKKKSLDSLCGEITKNDKNVIVSTKIEDVEEVHIIVTATNANEVILKNKFISPGTFIIDDAQPSDVDPEIIEGRQDVIVTEAGIIHDPGTSIRPNLELASEHDLFSCLAETVLLTINHKTDEHFSVGQLKEDRIKEINEMLLKSEFTTGEYQNTTGVIPKEQLNNVFRLIKKRYGSD